MQHEAGVTTRPGSSFSTPGSSLEAWCSLGSVGTGDSLNQYTKCSPSQARQDSGAQKELPRPLASCVFKKGPFFSDTRNRKGYLCPTGAFVCCCCYMFKPE